MTLTPGDDVMNCPECNVAPGNWHRPGCAWEQCPYCGEHAADCGCRGAPPPLDDRMRWAGCCSWVEACLRFGFFERRLRGRWVPCHANDPGSEPDVSRLMRECAWDREAKRFVLCRRTRR